MNLELQDHIVLVTGEAKGIGVAITQRFAAEGAIPCIIGRNAEEADALVNKLAAQDQRAAAFTCDLSDSAALAQVVADITTRFGRIDCVVNNAAANDSISLSSGPDAFRASLERNLIHVYDLIHLALPELIKSRGNIVNIGSKCAVTGQGGSNGYAAAKGALNALTRDWAIELAPHGIRSNCVIPAEVMTPLYEKWISSRPDPQAALQKIAGLIPLGHRFTLAEEIADTVAFVASARSAHTTGQLLYVDGGYTHLDRAVIKSSTE
jgi:L-fucose dehydrogenase